MQNRTNRTRANARSERKSEARKRNPDHRSNTERPLSVIRAFGSDSSFGFRISDFRLFVRHASLGRAANGLDVTMKRAALRLVGRTRPARFSAIEFGGFDVRVD